MAAKIKYTDPGHAHMFRVVWPERKVDYRDDDYRRAIVRMTQKAPTVVWVSDYLDSAPEVIRWCNDHGVPVGYGCGYQSEYWATPDGVLYATAPWLSEASGTVGASNIRVLFDENESHWVYSGNFGPNPTLATIKCITPVVKTVGYYDDLWVRCDNPDLAETMRELERYPLVDDEDHTKLEQEILDEQWGSWIFSDLRKEVLVLVGDELEDESEEYERIGAMEEKELRGHFERVCALTGTEPVFETHDTVHVDVKKLAAPVLESIRFAVENRRHMAMLAEQPTLFGGE